VEGAVHCPQIQEVVRDFHPQVVSYIVSLKDWIGLIFDERGRICGAYLAIQEPNLTFIVKPTGF